MRRSAAPILGLFLALSAHADTGEEVAQLLSLSLEDLLATKVTISTNTKQALSKAPSVVSVITAEDIKATGATNLMDVLQGVPGIYVRPNLFGFRPLVTVRGAPGPQALIMVNGAPVRDLVWSSGIFWKGLPTSMVERVEIIRGPGSALFGSDASAGVINVITKTAGRIAGTEAGGRAGSFDTREGWVQHGGNWNGFDIALTANLSRTDGHDPFIAKDGQTTNSYAPGNAHYGWNGTDLRFSMARDNWRFQADYERRGNLATGLSGGGVLDPRTRAEDSRFGLQLLYQNENFARDWGVNAELRYRDLESDSGEGFQEAPPTAAYPDGKINRQRSAERQWNFEAGGLYRGLKDHAIRLGGGYVWQDLYRVEHWVNYGTGPDGAALPAGGPLVNLSGSPYAFAPQKTRKIGYLFLQDAWTIGAGWELTAGLRYDDYSDFGRTLNPRLALVWQTSERLTTKLMYGEAFRAPSYLELYSRTAATLPNAALKPERSKTWDLSFSYLASRDLTLAATFYRFDQASLIADVAGQFQNAGNNKSDGVELEARWQATRTLRISGNLTDRRDSSTAFNTSPRQTAYLRADWAFLPKWNWNLQANWIGDRPPPAGDPRATIGDYTVADTTVRYNHSREWELAVSVRNLFDKDAREYSSKKLVNNLPLPGRSLYGELRYKF